MIQQDSKYYNQYYNHVLEKEKTEGTLGNVFDLIDNISDRRGLGNEWERIDGQIQDEIIEEWVKIINKK